jgi:hypothetical protein
MVRKSIVAFALVAGLGLSAPSAHANIFSDFSDWLVNVLNGPVTVGVTVGGGGGSGMSVPSSGCSVFDGVTVTSVAC